jgi:hypothetical protein
MNPGDVNNMNAEDQAKLNELINQKQMKDRCVRHTHDWTTSPTGAVHLSHGTAIARPQHVPLHSSTPASHGEAESHVVGFARDQRDMPARFHRRCASRRP